MVILSLCSSYHVQQMLQDDKLEYVYKISLTNNVGVHHVKMFP